MLVTASTDSDAARPGLLVRLDPALAIVTP
jgi:hypothetical protein